MAVLVTDLDHVQIAAPAGCEAEARRFFSGLLGLKEIEKPLALQSRGGCWFQVGSRQLHIGVEEPFHANKKAHPAFTVDDANSVFAVLEQSGAKCSWDDAVDGLKRFFSHDPWGNRLEFVEHVA